MQDPRLIVPRLSAMYESLEPYAYAALRVASGSMMAVFGSYKLFGNMMARDIEQFHQLGLEPAAFLAYFTSSLEFFGGIAIALGLLTRPLAAMFVIEFLVITFMVAIPRGAGYQLSVSWLGIYFYFFARGSGRLSVDAMIGRQF